MTIKTDAPDWAFDRAAELANEAGAPWTGPLIRSSNLGRAFAAYIAEHEQPQVDPLLVEAREVCAGHWEKLGCPAEARTIRNGLRDSQEAIQAALAALHRGIEIARETKP